MKDGLQMNRLLLPRVFTGHNSKYISILFWFVLFLREECRGDKGIKGIKIWEINWPWFAFDSYRKVLNVLFCCIASIPQGVYFHRFYFCLFAGFKREGEKERKRKRDLRLFRCLRICLQRTLDLRKPSRLQVLISFINLNCLCCFYSRLVLKYPFQSWDRCFQCWGLLSSCGSYFQGCFLIYFFARDFKNGIEALQITVWIATFTLAM